MYETKISENTISEYFGNGVLVFSGEISLIQMSSVHKRRAATTNSGLTEARFLIKSLVLAFSKDYQRQKNEEKYL